MTEIWFPTTFQHIGDSGWTVIWCGEIPEWMFVSPSVMEMLDVMPDHIAHEEDEWKGWDYAWQLLINKRVINIGYDVFYNRLIQEPFNLHKSDTDTLPNALAQMILWLHENKYITFPTHD